MKISLWKIFKIRIHWLKAKRSQVKNSSLQELDPGPLAYHHFTCVHFLTTLLLWGLVQQ